MCFCSALFVSFSPLSEFVRKMLFCFFFLSKIAVLLNKPTKHFCGIHCIHYKHHILLCRNNKKLFWKQTHWQEDMRKKPLLFLLLNPSHFVCWIVWEARSELLPEISISSIYAFVFLSGLWEWMTNDTHGSTSRSPKLWERSDLSLLLTCAISLHTLIQIHDWIHLFPWAISSSVLLHSPCFDLYSRIKICCLYKRTI